MSAGRKLEHVKITDWSVQRHSSGRGNASVMEINESPEIGSAEITRLKSEIRLLEERLAATEPDVSPLSEHAARIVRGDLARLQDQLDRLTKVDP